MHASIGGTLPNIFHISPASTNIGDEVIALGVRQFIDRAFDHKANIIRLPTQTNYRMGGLTPQSVHAINRLGTALWRRATDLSRLQSAADRKKAS